MVRYRSLCAISLMAFCAACGMAERDDSDSKSYDYLTLQDQAFKSYCLEAFDTNRDGKLSRYEAEGVRCIDCSARGIASLSSIEAFTQLEELNCANNKIEHLDLDNNHELQRVNCAGNGLKSLEIGSLRRLTKVDCSDNRLTELALNQTASLHTLDCRQNLFTILDLAPCNAQLKADARQNPQLEIIYYRSGQQVNYGAPAVLVER